MAALTDEEALGVAITLHTDFGQYCSRPWFFHPYFYSPDGVSSTGMEHFPMHL